MKTANPLKKRIILYVLFLISIFSFYLLYSKNNDYNNLKEVLNRDKQDLQEELNGIVKEYKQLNIKNKKLTKRVTKEINKIIALKDSVGKLESQNYDLIRTFRRRTTKLQNENRLLIAKVDSLNLVNINLQKENILARETLNEKNIFNKELENKNYKLARVNKKLKKEIKIAPSKEIKTSAIRAFAMRERSSGKLDVTTKHNKVDAFRINFKLLKNNLKKPGKIKIHIQIINSSNTVISAKPKKFKLKNRARIEYSDYLIADYKNEEIDILSLVLVDRNKISEGEYKVNIFIDGIFNTSSLIFL